jgi:2-succinyl-6-hydroxy-2,4-cyclohexadiene-1-carboxylate synthase
MKYVLDGVRYHVRMCGEGFPLLALHGFTGNGATWFPFCEKWGNHSSLIMPDIIGHGHTESPGDYQRYSVEAAANDIRHLLDQMGIEKTDLLGYSMGGRLAVTFAILFPERVRKLVLESASPGLQEKRERSERRTKDGRLANLILEQGIESFISYWESISLFESLEKMPATINEGIRAQRLQNSPTGLANSLIGMGTGSQPSWWDHLGDLSCEVLLITGAEDQKFCRIAEKMESCIRNVLLVTVKGAGHIIHVEQSEKFGTIVSGFLSNT